MNIYQPSRIQRAVVIAATTLAVLSVSMSPADASGPRLEAERPAQVQQQKAPKCAEGAQTPSGTHCYLPAVVAPQTASAKVMLFVQRGV